MFEVGDARNQFESVALLISGGVVAGLEDEVMEGWAGYLHSESFEQIIFGD